MKFTRLLIATVIGLAACSGDQPEASKAATARPAAASAGQEVDPRWIWDLSSLYPSLSAWDAARTEVLDHASRVEKLKGSLSDGPAALLDAVREVSALTKSASRVYTYASLDADENVAENAGQERRQLAQQMYSQVTQAFAWMAPEIIALGHDRISAYIKAEPQLAEYRHTLNNTLRKAPHVRSAEVEDIMAAVQLLQAQPFNVYGTLANSDIPFPTLEVAEGDSVLLNSQGYSRHRGHPERSVRQAVFEGYWNTWADYESSVGQALSAHIQSQVFETRQRNYADTLTRNLFSDALPSEVYDTLVKVTNDNLDTLHRYLRLRAKVLGIKDLNYHDIYVDLVQPTRTFPIEDTITLVQQAMAPLGPDYQAQLAQATSQRWMHVYPSKGKRSGAYMAGSAYDVHPFILLNHQEDFNSVSTYAHEWGHGIHQVLSNENQPWHLSDFSIFTTEAAAIANELLVQNHMVQQSRSDEEMLFYLAYSLENIRTTFFRQTMFSEFEGAIYNAIENGEALSGARITALYADIVRRYHGHDEGVMTVPDLYTREWMFVPHFYFNYYVFQYATSIAGAAYFVEQLSADKEDTSARDTYLAFLKAGGSEHPYELFRQAGLDMASPAPYEALIRRMNELMDAFEATWARVHAPSG